MKIIDNKMDQNKACTGKLVRFRHYHQEMPVNMNF